MNPSDPLSQLRDIHLPAPISWWPLAPGWYILAILILVLIAIASVCWYRHRQKWRKQQVIFHMLENYMNQQPPHWTCVNLLIKRVAFIHHSRKHIAGLHGEAWLTWLDTITQTTAYTQHEGRILLTWPYQKNSPNHADLTPLIKKTLIKLLNKPTPS